MYVCPSVQYLICLFFSTALNYRYIFGLRFRDITYDEWLGEVDKSDVHKNRLNERVAEWTTNVSREPYAFEKCIDNKYKNENYLYYTNSFALITIYKTRYSFTMQQHALFVPFNTEPLFNKSLEQSILRMGIAQSE
jgi:hypothetical protein